MAAPAPLHAPAHADVSDPLLYREDSWRAHFAAMRRDALLVNCARGGIVDEVALAAALYRGELAGAGVDVLSEEPPTQGNPLLDLNVPTLIVTPHMAFASIQSLETLAEQLIGNIEAFVAGKPRNLIVPGE